MEEIDVVSMGDPQGLVPGILHLQDVVDGFCFRELLPARFWVVFQLLQVYGEREAEAVDCPNIDVLLRAGDARHNRFPVLDFEFSFLGGGVVHLKTATGHSVPFRDPDVVLAEGYCAKGARNTQSFRPGEVAQAVDVDFEAVYSVTAHPDVVAALRLDHHSLPHRACISGAHDRHD